MLPYADLREEPGLAQLKTVPQKSDIEVDKVMLVWLPWRIDSKGTAEPVY